MLHAFYLILVITDRQYLLLTITATTMYCLYVCMPSSIHCHKALVNAVVRCTAVGRLQNDL